MGLYQGHVGIYTSTFVVIEILFCLFDLFTGSQPNTSAKALAHDLCRTTPEITIHLTFSRLIFFIFLFMVHTLYIVTLSQTSSFQKKVLFFISQNDVA